MHHLVLGGAGFIGSHLCEALVTRGDTVLCVDNMSTGRFQNVHRFLLSRPESFRLRQLDVRTQDSFDDMALENLHFSSEPTRFETVWNLACPASPPAYQADPIGTTMTCVLGTHHALNLAIEHNAVFVQASTSEVYGDPTVHPQPESYRGNVNPIGPRACYDEGKRCAESICFDYRRTRKARVRVARIFNTYGPRMSPDDGRVVTNFIKQALLGEKLAVYGSGNTTRSFCYVSDMVRGLIALSQLEDDACGPINLGNPQEHTLISLAERVLKLTGRVAHGDVVSSKLHEHLSFVHAPEDDPRRRRPDISRAFELLRWTPTVCLEDGLRETIESMRRELSLTDP